MRLYFPRIARYAADISVYLKKIREGSKQALLQSGSRDAPSKVTDNQHPGDNYYYLVFVSSRLSLVGDYNLRVFVYLLFPERFRNL